MFSASSITGAIAAVAIAVTLALPHSAPPDGVALDADSGTAYFTTIADAITAADDGDTVRVGPGTYVESLVIDKDIILKADAPTERVILRAPDDGPMAIVQVQGRDPRRGEVELPYAIRIVGADATVSGLTVEGRRSGIIAEGGSPTLEHLRLVEVGWPLAGSGNEIKGIHLFASDAHIRNNELVGGGNIQAAGDGNVRVEDNVLLDGPAIAGSFGPDGVVRGNEIRDPSYEGIQIEDGGAGSVEDNILHGIPRTGILLGWNDATETVAAVRGNHIEGAFVGIQLIPGARAEIVENEVTGARIGLLVNDSDGIVSGNRFIGNPLGIAIQAGAPTLEGNTVTETSTALQLTGSAAPQLSGNTICGTDVSIRLIDGAELPDTTGNDVCETLATN